MSDELFSVAGQIVLVSGGSRGIGKALADGFARRGARVILTGRSESNVATAVAELSTGADRAVSGKVCDVADPKAIARLVEEVLNDFGAIDTLVNVAGVNRRMPAEANTADDYDFVMNTNVKGAFLLSLAVAKPMLERRRGSQINIASLNNFRPVKGVVPYAMSKAAMGHMTRALALEWGDRGVRVNALAPGFILTDLTAKLWSNPHMQEWVHANTPLRRLGQPQDMIGTAIFLASEASAFLTGQVLFVDGGFSCGIAWPIDFAKQ